LEILAYHYVVQGQVQGVGFRPYIYRLATEYQLVGWVKNVAGQVEIFVQGQNAQLAAFDSLLLPQAPKIAKPHILLRTIETPQIQLVDFQILASTNSETAYIHVPVDYAPCEQCLIELNQADNPRYRYPFINCTQCGPRYTIIANLPYDRPNTSMSGFNLCAYCAAEYHNPADRRFHAQPLACPSCGPQLQFKQGDILIEHTEQALKYAKRALAAGYVLAIKGVGGYHLCCDASQDRAVEYLRRQKARPDKALAVMFPLNYDLSQQVILSTKQRELLESAARPIILAKKAKTYNLSPACAPKLLELGVVLPYSPLHILLLNDFNAPIVATSANISGEPLLTTATEVEQRLSQVAQAYLHHNRPILRPAEDSVYTSIAGQNYPLRLGRGFAPVELKLAFKLPEPCLAVGGQLKNTIALAWDNRVVISPHIGDLSSRRSQEIFQNTINDLQRLYAVKAQRIICDAHTDYASSHWAMASDLPVHKVWHHHAHAAAVVGEYGKQNWLIFVWDGVGLGCDGSLWGGETLYGQPGQWQRLARLRPLPLIGGDKVATQMWRSALGLALAADIEPAQLLPNLPINNTELALLIQAWQKGISCLESSAIGRLFDAIAALTGVLMESSFEAQAGMYLEALCIPEYEEFIALPVRIKNNLWEMDWQPLLHYLLLDNVSLEQKITCFHNSLAHGIIAQLEHILAAYTVGQIGLCGGVFQNRYLSEKIINLLQQKSLPVYLPQRLPLNDASISFGQIIEAHP
jgi:hydrogenase maturation protein HypF